MTLWSIYCSSQVRSVADIFPTATLALLAAMIVVGTRETSVGHGDVGRQLAWGWIGLAISGLIMGFLSILEFGQPHYWLQFVGCAILLICACVTVVFAKSLPLGQPDWWWHTRGSGTLGLQRYSWELAALTIILILLGTFWSALDSYLPWWVLFLMIVWHQMQIWFSHTMMTLFFWVVTPCRLTLKMKTVCSSKTFVSTYEFTWHHNPEEEHRHPHRCDHLKSHIITQSLSLCQCQSLTSTVKMEVVCYSEMLVSTYMSIWHYYPEDQHWHFQCCENLKSLNYAKIAGTCQVYWALKLAQQSLNISSVLAQDWKAVLFGVLSFQRCSSHHIT
jgi:hypothetical protein